MFPAAINAVVLDPSEHKLYAGGSDGVIYQADLYPYTPKYIQPGGTKNISIDVTTGNVFKGHK